jgi:hypothetical protein
MARRTNMRALALLAGSRPKHLIVVPAKAGTQSRAERGMDSRFHGNDNQTQGDQPVVPYKA